MRFWSILGTDKIRVGCFFFWFWFSEGILIFCCGMGTGIWVWKGLDQQLHVIIARVFRLVFLF